ncbi:MAG: methyltransferase domain-containing protein [Chloroflexales bacterium]|nr:methyltransferase domain-containing protein [Chloroflexales bacterium]
MLTPHRTHRRELLDAPITNQAELAANLADIRAVNRWLGGSTSIIRAVACVITDWELARPQAPITLLDVATGSADTPRALGRWAQRQGIPLQVYASDLRREVLAEAQHYTHGAIPLICHDALRLPYADKSVDVITCAQVLHHCDEHAAIALLRELKRVARRAVVISDLVRSWPAYWGARLLGLVQRSAMSRHDGPLSVLRAYTPGEVRELLRRTGLDGVVQMDGPLRMTIRLMI